MLSKRIVSAVIGIILLIAILMLDKVFLNIGIAIISIIGLYELYSSAEDIKKSPLRWLGYASAPIVAFSSYIKQDWLLFIIFTYFILLCVCMMFSHHNIGLNQIAVVLFSTMYICYFFQHIFYTRQLTNGNVLVWLIFIGAWTTDTFAYFVGTYFGKNKLLPEISPKKTIEGAVGGIIGCSLSCLFYGYLLHIIRGYELNYFNLVILGLICSVMSEFGDLFASCIKRQYGVKDFGKIMPGHGGVLDRFDSILFVAPTVYYFVKYFHIFI